MTSPDIHKTLAEASQALADAHELIRQQQIVIEVMAQRLRELDANNVVANANDPRELT